MLRSHENFYQKSSCVFAALIGPLLYVNQKHNYITKEMCYYQKVGDEQILINSSSYFWPKMFQISHHISLQSHSKLSES